MKVRYSDEKFEKKNQWEKKLVAPGFEPTTIRLPDRRPNQLSHEANMKIAHFYAYVAVVDLF